MTFNFCATLAQLVEQLIRNEQVIGSNPMGGFWTFFYAHSSRMLLWYSIVKGRLYSPAYTGVITLFNLADLVGRR